MSGFRQGDIHFGHSFEDSKMRPAVVISRSDLNAHRMNIAVAFITTTIREIPTEIPVGPAEGLSKDSVIDLCDIKTLPKTHFTERIGGLAPKKMDRLHDGLKLLFAIP